MDKRDGTSGSQMNDGDHMNRRSLLKLAGAAALTTATSRFATSQPGQAPSSDKKAERPNILFIIMDDLGWRDVGFNGSDFYDTPNIDRLRSRGVFFSNAYGTCPVCSPSRASVMTGQYPPRVGITNYLRGESPRPFAKFAHPEFLQSLPLDAPTIAKTLKKAGYTTAMGGKWHLGPEEEIAQHGFDRVFTTHGGPYWSELTGYGEQFIEDNRTRPFYLYLAHNLVHTPLQSTHDRIEKYTEKSNRFDVRTRKITAPQQNNPIYAAMVSEMDESIGRLVKKIEDIGASDRTIIFFTSDHGGLITPERDRHTTVTDNRPLRGGKGCLYEGGIRVPAVMYWPGVTKAGTTVDVPIAHVDHYPTILEMTGVSDEPSHKLDGESLVPLLSGSNKLKRDSIYWHYPHYNIEGGWPSAAVRKGNLKLIESYEDKNVELYDLSQDISESNDLSKSNPKKTREMLEQLRAWQKDVGARMPLPNPKYDAAREFVLSGPALPRPGSTPPPIEVEEPA